MRRGKIPEKGDVRQRQREGEGMKEAQREKWKVRGKSEGRRRMESNHNKLSSASGHQRIIFMIMKMTRCTTR